MEVSIDARGQHASRGTSIMRHELGVSSHAPAGQDSNPDRGAVVHPQKPDLGLVLDDGETSLAARESGDTPETNIFIPVSRYDKNYSPTAGKVGDRSSGGSAFARHQDAGINIKVSLVESKNKYYKFEDMSGGDQTGPYRLRMERNQYNAFTTTQGNAVAGLSDADKAAAQAGALGGAGLGKLDRMAKAMLWPTMWYGEAVRNEAVRRCGGPVMAIISMVALVAVASTEATD
jgi:hypothetical protein